MGIKPIREYIYQDGQVYKRVAPKKQFTSEVKQESYKRGKKMGEEARLWFTKLPDIEDMQILRFNLDPEEYRRGFEEGFENGG